MPYIIARRPEIQNGSVQITDLFPSDSQRNLVNDPKGQGPFYVRVSDIGDTGNKRPIIKVNADNSTEFLREARGLVAYLVANIEAVPGGAADALTLAEAEDIASGLLARVRAGQSLTAANVNAVCNGVSAGSGIGQGNSTATLADILAILAGEEYTVSGGIPIQAANGTFAAVIGPGALGSTVRSLVPNDASWKISFSEGVLAGLTSVRDGVNGDLFAGVRSTSPLLTVYNDDGTIYS